MFHDVDGELHVAVTVDDDPAAEALLAGSGRYFFFAPDEVDRCVAVTAALRCSWPASATSSSATTASASRSPTGCADARRCPTGVRVEDFGIRGVHLAYELLDGYDALVLVDAVPMGEAPGTVAVLEPEVDELDAATARRRSTPTR